jgi:hypothetical protein
VTGLMAVIGLYVLATWGLAQWAGVEDQFSLLLYSGPVVRVSIMLFLIFVGWRVYSLILFERPARLGLALIRDIRRRLFTRAQIAAALPIFLGFLFFMAAFSTMKAMIPAVHAYTWDPFFAALDRAIHGGIDPWRILQPIFGHAWITSIINIVYNLWFVAMFSVLYWQLFDLRRPQLRLRFFWAFFLCFIINGSILAILLSSAGPCYYGLVAAGDNPFAEQMDYLRGLAEHYPVWAVQTQDRLWETYKDNHVGMGSGISAMPSVHVSIAFLMALLAWRHGRLMRWFFGIFAAVIMIGSVHLGWHYAADGYLAIIVTAAIWWGTGKAMRE